MGELWRDHGLGLDIGLQTENCKVGKIIILKKSKKSDFYPRDAMLAQVFATAMCLDVCPSATHRYCA